MMVCSRGFSQKQTLHIFLKAKKIPNLSFFRETISYFPECGLFIYLFVCLFVYNKHQQILN